MLTLPEMTKEERMMSGLMENCAAKAVISGLIDVKKERMPLKVYLVTEWELLLACLRLPLILDYRWLEVIQQNR